MASPVPKFPEIISDLKQRGVVVRTPFGPLYASIMRITGAIKSDTIKNIIKSMETLEYLKKTSINGIDFWFLCRESPGKFPKSATEDEEEKLEKY